MSNPFEKHIKQSLENYEAQYNPADWADLQKKLHKAKAGNSSLGKGLLIAASVLAVAGAIYYFSISNSENTTREKTSASQLVTSVPIQENPVQQTETNNSQSTTVHPKNLTSSTKEKLNVNNKVTEHTPSSPEKTETLPVTTSLENKIPVQEQSKTAEATHPSSGGTSSGTSFHSNKTKVCPGETVQFSTDNVIDGTCRWDFGDGEISTERNPDHVFKDAGTYIVKLRVTSKEQKSAEQLMKNTITVLPPPVINMDYSSTDELIPVINFEARADGVSQWKWEFGDKTTSSEQNPEHTYNKKGNYDVTTTAKNSSGCTATIHRNIKYEFKLLAPTGFSPNGDGRNDTWLPVALFNGDYTFTLTIMDKTGTTVIYETSDKDHPWDGMNTHSGETFQWKIMVKDKNGKEITDRGVITIAD